MYVLQTETMGDALLFYKCADSFQNLRICPLVSDRAWETAHPAHSLSCCDFLELLPPVKVTPDVILFFLNARQTLFGKLHINSQQQINRSNSVCIIAFTMKKLCHNGCFCRSVQIPGPCNLFRCVCGTSEVFKLFIWVQEEGEGKKCSMQLGTARSVNEAWW